MAPSLGAALTAELVGTFLLVFTVGCNVLTGNAVWGGVSIGCVLMVAIFALGGISGANFNPAVTLALVLARALGHEGGLDVKTGGMYVGKQIVGGLFAAFAYTCVFGHAFALGPAPGFSFVHAGLCEVLYTFMLCFVVLNVAIAKKNSPNQFYGLAIGYVIIAGAYGAGAVSGGCFNPAVAIGISAVSSTSIWMALAYIFCECVGACLAVGAFKAVRPDDFGGEKTLAAEAVSEFLGTFILVLTVGLNVLGKSPAGAFSIAASLMSMIYSLGNVSGAHFNPAVTVAIFLSGRCKDDLTPGKAGTFVGAQMAGAAAAAAAYSVIHKGGSFALGPGAGWGYSSVGVAEGIFTFVLCYVVLSVAVAKVTHSPVMFGLAIGGCVTVGGNAIGAISGGSLNPAVSFGISVAHLHAGGSLGPFVAYSIFECLGAAAAAGVFKVTHAVDLADGLKEADNLKGTA